MLWKLLAIEAIALAQAADQRKQQNVMGGDYKKLHALVRSVCPTLQGDRPLADEIRAVAELLQTDDAQKQCLAPGGDHEAD
jgi:histidine ammonia-lyase